MSFKSLGSDHWFFCVIDGFIYAVVFLLLVATLRASLRRLARHEADHAFMKSFASTLIILLSAPVIAGVPYAERLGYLILLPFVLLGTAILKLLCWVSFKRGFLIMMIFAATAFGASTGFMMLVNRALPKDRITLAGRIKVSMGILDDLAGRASEPMITSNFLHDVKGGLRLQTESFASAVALLRDSDRLAKMTAEHAADLKSLGLVLDGEKLTPEQLAAMGIVYEDARKGVNVLHGISATNNVSEQDVQDVVSLLRSVRKDGSEVTANDAVLVIREAMKRAGMSSTNAGCAVNTNDVAGDTPVSLTRTSTAIAVEWGSAGLPPVATAPSDVRRAGVGTAIRQVQNRDPLLDLGAAERAQWNASRTGLVVTAVVFRRSGGALAMVNGRVVRKGDVVSITSRGKSFTWRVVDFTARNVIWEPVVAQSADEKTFISWR